MSFNSKKAKCLLFITVIFPVVDVCVTTVLYSHGTGFKEHFTQGFYAYSVFTSLFDVWSLSILRATLLLGLAIGVMCNPKKGVQRAKKVVRVIAVITVILWVCQIIKLLLFSDAVSNLRKPWFWALFCWTLIASVLMFVLWWQVAELKVISKKKYHGINSTIGEREGLINANTTLSSGSEDSEDEEKEHHNGNRHKKKKKKASRTTSIFRLLKLSKDDWPFILAGFFFLLCAAGAEVFLPYYTGQVIDGIVIEQSYEKFTNAIIIMSAISLTAGFAAGSRGCLLLLAMNRLGLRVRNLLFGAIMKQETGFFDKIQTGEITSRLTSDATTMSESVGLNINIFLRSLVKAIGTCVFMFKLSWQLTLVTFIGLPIIIGFSTLYGEYYEKLSKEIQDTLAIANNVAEETCSSMKTVRSFANETAEVQRYKDKLQDSYKLYKKEALAYGAFMWCNEVFELSLTVATLYYGGHLVLNKTMTGGNLVSFILYQLELGDCFESIGNVFTSLMQAVGASHKVFEYMDRKPEVINDGTCAPAHLNGLLQFRQVHFSYPTRPDEKALKDVSFQVKPGEVVALVGPSGGGKSSCVNLLEHFYETQSGEVLLDGIPVKQYDHKYLHRKIALVGQEPVLYARSIRENIAYGMEEECSIEEVQLAAKKANAHQFILEMKDGYETQAGEKGLQLSGGQKQRIAIARALLRDPKVLLLDEATSALDAESEHVVQQAIYNNLHNHTVIIVAHRLSTVEKANRIVVIDKGTVVEEGTHKDLLAAGGLYTKLVQRQIMGFDDFANENKAKSDTVKINKKRRSSSSSSDSSSSASVGSPLRKL
ncbi:ATP-binding cassette sub-family B member 9 isoform X1 [Lingula anatina]|uniref:ABC-type oligopeptide transporter ABCB9 n=1 Tax=Lingula anatina TaxID=7574 RepID=A0A1S3ISW5_LINAN|nr:ATP-binding cassette sub-family B member 9 isoform X1 [Lingula anatina]|eukprot:XP_013401168.1 ATP-binding cassette sub-family B member 9 isoform X1 [Lingula anatina]